MFSHDHTEDMSYWRDGSVVCDRCDSALTVDDLMAATYHFGDTYLWLQQGDSSARYTVGIVARAQQITKLVEPLHYDGWTDERIRDQHINIYGVHYTTHAATCGPCQRTARKGA